jgi:hypothetical protein
MRIHLDFCFFIDICIAYKIFFSLGYITWSGPHFHLGVQGYRTVIQSSIKDPIYLNSRIENFLLLAGVCSEKQNQDRVSCLSFIHKLQFVMFIV